MTLGGGTIQVMPIFDFGMHLIHTPLFEHVDLGVGDNSDVDAVERQESH